jgi:uncharacterized lipoprotein NlpE involved in copper resistance
MISKKIIFIVSVVCLSLNACSSKSGSSSIQTPEITADNSQNSLDWEGTYSGVVPCADCSGIETKISLALDNTYRISWKYLEKSDEVYVKEGTFVWDSTGSIITLNNMETEAFPTMYKVCENYLLQLDLDGNVITGTLADNYRLNKD